MIRYFYNYPTSGDTLFILIEPEMKTLHTKSVGNVTALYGEGEKFLGYNVFEVSKTLKIQSDGMIFAPSPLFVEAVNAILVGASFSPLPFTKESGYHVYKIEKFEEHPLNEKAKIVTLLGANEERLSTVSSLLSLKVGKEVVAAKDDTILLDGTHFHKHVEKNIPLDVLILSPKGLRLGESDKEAFLLSETLPLGSDFFYRD